MPLIRNDSGTFFCGDFIFELSAKILWPLFPLLLLVVVVCLTLALVLVVRRVKEQREVLIQVGALICYLLAAVSAIASESGSMSVNVHRPFSLLTQAFILWGMYCTWEKGQQGIFLLNSLALGAILADTALHFLLVK